jgi:hypothetical protein
MFSPSLFAKADEGTPFTFDMVAAECERLTGDDYLDGAAPKADGTVPTIKDYFQNVETYYYTSSMYDGIYHYDHIFRIIPKDLFRNAGEWFYKGYDYSFYINTWESITGDADYFSEVAIINNDYAFNHSTGEISLKVSIFSRWYKNYYSIWDDSLFVVEDYGEPFTRYFLSDVVFSTMIMNEHTNNATDNHYSKINDNGIVISQSRLNYSGIYNRVTDITADPIIEQIGKNAVKVIEKGIGMIPVIGNVYNTMKGVLDDMEYIASCFQDKTVNVSNNNEANIMTYMTKQAQIDDPSLPYLIRAVAARAQEPNLLIDKYAQMITVLSDGNAETRVAAGVAYNLYIDDLYDDYIIVDSGEKKLFTNQNDYSESIKSIYEEVAFEKNDTAKEGDNNGYLLSKDSEQTFEFIPERNGEYTITTDKGHLINVKNKVIDSGISIKTRYEAGEKYYIVVKPDGDSNLPSYNLKITFTPQKAVIGGNPFKINRLEEEFFSFTPQRSGIYHLDLQEDLSDVILRVDRLLSSNVEKIMVCNRETDVFMYAGEEYFIVFTNIGRNNYPSVNFLLSESEEIVENAHALLLKMRMRYSL